MKRLLLIVIPFLWIGCENNTVDIYSYTQQRAGDAPVVSGPALEIPSGIQWALPSGWVEESGQGFRLASFYEEGNRNSIETTIIRLGGIAGGIRANIERWLGQIDADPLDDKAMNQLIESLPVVKIASGEPGLVIDLTPYVNSSDQSAPTIVAGIVDTPVESIFIKMTGSVEDVERNRSAFNALIHSLEIHHD